MINDRTSHPSPPTAWSAFLIALGVILLVATPIAILVWQQKQSEVTVRSVRTIPITAPAGRPTE